MFKLSGILKRIEEKTFIRKNGEQGSSRILYVEPDGSVYPVKVNVQDKEMKFGKEGDKIILDVSIFPYHIQDKKRKRAFVDYYIPNKK